MDNPDITVIGHGSLFGLTPETDEGERWLADNLPDDVQRLGSTRFCEGRYLEDIVVGARQDGLSVE